ncbi:MAG: Uma2 family endonuclease [Sphingomonas sp.]
MADTTGRYDLTEKARLYAAAGIAEYWVVEIGARVIHQMWAPEGEAYTERREVAFGERIAAATVEGLAVETVGV